MICKHEQIVYYSKCRTFGEECYVARLSETGFEIDIREITYAYDDDLRL